MRARSRVVYAALLALFASGCPLDDRELVEYPVPAEIAGRVGAAGRAHGAVQGGEHGAEHAGSAGSALSGVGGAAGGMPAAALGGSEPVSNAGNAGVRATADAGESGLGTGGAPTDRCPDLDENGVPDCDETLVINPDFSRDSENWTADASVEQAWEMGGVLSVAHLAQSPEDAVTMAGTRQCTRVDAGTTYVLYARMRILPGEGAGSGGLNTLFFGSEDCSGATLPGGFSSSRFSAVDHWHVPAGNGTAPSGAKSMAVRLVVIKAFREPPVEALFDDVLVKAF